MRLKKILVLVHESCVPPEKSSHKKAEWANWKTEYYVAKTLRDIGHDVRVVGVHDNVFEIKAHLDDFKPHIVFNLLEEFGGEPLYDQNVVSFLELMNVPYTGCNPQGLTMGRDKATTKKILNYHGIQTPKFFVADQGKSWSLPEGIKFPLIVKSLIEEASLGISQDSVVKSVPKLRKRIEFIHNTLDTPALIEEYVQGRELYAGVVGNGKLEVLPLWELQFGKLKNNGFPIATRTVKFNKEYCQRHTIRRGPARGLDEVLTRRIAKLCKKAYRALRLNGYARMDLRLTSAGEIYFLEVNPNPELAWGEDLANAARHGGITYPSLIQRIVDLGLSWPKAS